MILEDIKIKFFNALDTLPFHELVDIFYRRQKVIVTFFLTVVLVVGIQSFLMTPVYKATATILIDEESPNVLTTTGTVALQSPDYLSYKEYYQSQIEILTSKSLARKVFGDFRLGERKEYADAKEPVRVFLRNVKVEPVRDTRLALLSVEDRDPILAAQIANRMADLFVKRNLYYISRNELMNLFKNEYLKLESKLNEYSKIYKDKHPKMIELKEQMSELVKKIERVKDSKLDYTLLERDIQPTGQFALASLKANNISVQDPADVPVIPIRPNKRLNVFLAALVGLFGGAGLALFLEYEDKTIKDVEDIEAITNWPLLGKVPVMVGEEKEFSVKDKAADLATEAYRSIRTRLSFLSGKGRALKGIVISSLGAGEGKTMTACNLAIAMAHSGKKVLLVDADMRRPRLHTLFKKEEAKGLSSFLGGNARYDDLLQETTVENLSLVAAGNTVIESTELLHSEKMKEFISLAEKDFDFVFFDSPPIGILTDATILASFLDGLILVVESGKTPRKAVVRNDKTFKHDDIKVLGVVINKALTKGSEGYYYYYSDVYSHSGRRAHHPHKK